MKTVFLMISISLGSGCAGHMLKQMANMCRGAGVKEIEVVDGYIRVICKDGSIERRRQ